MIQTNFSKRPNVGSFFGGIRDAISNWGKRNPTPTDSPKRIGFPTRDEFIGKTAPGGRTNPGRTDPAVGTGGTKGKDQSFFQNLLDRFLDSRLGKTGFGKAIGMWAKAMSMGTKPMLPPTNGFGVD